jgi:precorrin-2 dehydrogenase/sirohydrochlorin ferrochelatase
MKTPAYFPAFLNVAGRKCVVVGGGHVALRKVEAFLARGAQVRLIADVLCPELRAMVGTGQVSLDERRYRPGDLSGAFVAIAATDDRETNIQISGEAREACVLVNVVDDADLSDFIFPSVITRGDITVAVSTAGRSPALARKIRARLDKEFGPEYGDLAALAGEVRAETRETGNGITADEWQDALELDELLGLLRNGERQRAKDLLLANLTRQSKAPIQEGSAVADN